MSTILVVDDDAPLREVVRMALQLGGFTVVEAGDGRAALDMLDRASIDLVVLDIGMPGMDGCELARRLREQEWGKRVTLVALTGWGQDEDRRRTKSAGFDHHFVKPADHEALQALLRQPAGRH